MYCMHVYAYIYTHYIYTFMQVKQPAQGAQVRALHQRMRYILKELPPGVRLV